MTLMFPKPKKGTKKKQQKKRKDKDYGIPKFIIGPCPFCGRRGKHWWHHVFGGALKKKSEKYHAIEYPCWNCHELDNGSIEKDAAWKRQLRQKHQRRIMKEQRWTMEDWIAEFKENYLEDEI